MLHTSSELYFIWLNVNSCIELTKNKHFPGYYSLSAPALLETPGFESSLHFCKLDESLRKMHYINIDFFLNKICTAVLQPWWAAVAVLLSITLPCTAWSALLCLWLATSCPLSNEHVQLSSNIEQRRDVHSVATREHKDMWKRMLKQCPV